MRPSRRLVAAARKRAFPWQRRVPRSATEALECAREFALSCRAAGETGPTIVSLLSLPLHARFALQRTTQLDQFPAVADLAPFIEEQADRDDDAE